MNLMDRKLYFSLFLTIMATALGASLVLPLLPVYAQEMGATGLQLSLIFSSFALARSIALPLVGRLADEYGRRGFMLFGLLVYVLVSVGFDQSKTVWQLVLCRLIQGGAAAMVIPIARAYVGDMAEPGQEGRVMGHFNMAFFAGLAVGPSLGGFVKDLVGMGSAFYSMGGLALVGLIMAWASLPRTKGPLPGDSTKKPTSYFVLLKNPALAAIFLFRFGSMIGLGMNWTFMPLFGHEVLSLSASRIGILVSVTVVMTTLLQPTFGRLADQVNRAGMTFIGGFVGSLCLLGIPFCSSFYHLLALNLVMGTAMGLYMPPLMAIAVDQGRELGFMTRVMSLLEMAFSLGMVIGPLVAGKIYEVFGLSIMFWFGGAVGLLTCLIFLGVAAKSEPKGAKPEGN